MILDTLRESPHWYSQEGQPMHDADLRKARKLQLLPSVTSVLQMWPKPALENYKVESAILAALTLPRKSGEQDDAFAKRVIDDMHTHREKAGILGKALHDVCERLSCGRIKLQDLEDSPYYAYAECFWDWFQENITKVYSAETVVVSKRYGYAGTYDLLADTRHWGRAKLDYKSQGVKKAPRFYDEWGFQLAAYQQAVHEQIPDFIDARVSVVIDSTKPSHPAIKVWDANAGPDFERFTACLDLWRLAKSFPYVLL